MTFQPIIPLQGFAGWKFLERTIDTQQEAFYESAQIQRLTENFREKIGAINSAEDLVNDRQLLQVALGAFGLEDDIDNKYFIQKVLEDGTLSDDALANRLSDKRYLEMSEAFGFGDFPIPNTALSTFADSIIQRFQGKSFEIAVGSIDNSMRLALNFNNELGEVIESSSNQDAQWFSVMGNPPLREVFETALGLPSSIGAIDIDVQLEAFKQGAQRNFGTDQLSEIANPDDEEKMIRLFLLRNQVQASAGLSGGSVALTLLRQF